MKTIHVRTKAREYDILVEKGLLPHAGQHIRRLIPPGKAAVITDDHVDALYGPILEDSLVREGFTVKRIVFPAGEKSKNLTVLGTIYSDLAAFGMTRSDLVITLGGGVPGDLGGLAAATFLRGLPFIQIPTSLLAQIDSSVGGKVAADLEEGKNLVGAFYQPMGVLIDPDLLQTLPLRYLHDGCAEAVKYGCIADESLFQLFEQIRDDAGLLDHAEDIITVCCRIKADIVERDEYDTGERMILNFGHTLGHAVEAAGQYERWTHGEGVAIGIVMITEASERQGLTKAGTVRRIREVLERLHLPVTVALDKEQLLGAVGHDKKKRGDDITLVIVPSIGSAELLPMAFSKMTSFLTGEQ